MFDDSVIGGAVIWRRGYISAGGENASHTLREACYYSDWRNHLLFFLASQSTLLFDSSQQCLSRLLHCAQSILVEGHVETYRRTGRGL